MNSNRKSLLAITFCGLGSWQAGLAQMTPPAILEIDVVNQVQYFEDTSDLSKLAADQSVTAANQLKNFGTVVNISDIVAVNGQPAKGTVINNSRVLTLRTAPNPGEAIADIVRNAVTAFTLEILTSDGAPIGTIMASGLAVGFPPPGAPLKVTQANNAIVGGTGAFLGARGQLGQTVVLNPIPARAASMTEDPANRRKNGGGRARYVLHVIPQSQPQIVATASGPAVFHADFSPITAAKPAKAGEVLIARATGLGPTLPGVNPGQPFPLDAVQQVNSPVEVSVNGQSAEVINAIGWPGFVDTYRVDFRVPDGTTAGAATIQMSAAWIAGPAVSIAVQ